MKSKEFLQKLKTLGTKKNLEGMKRFGINTENAYGVDIYTLRKFIKGMKKDHTLALDLWDSGVHEARIAASMVDDPEKITSKQMEEWVKDFDSWDVCDLVCSNIIDKTKFAYKKAFQWSKRKEEYVKRAGFVLMAALSVHDKEAEDADFIQFFPVIIRESTDGRNFVKKAVNWALRQIGKRNAVLNKKAIQTAKLLSAQDSKAARWIAKDALRELTGEKVQKRLKTIAKR